MGFKSRARDRRESARLKVVEEIFPDPDLMDPVDREKELIARYMAVMRQYSLQFFADSSMPDRMKVGSCVRESRVLAEILNAVGIESKIICSDMSVWNESCRQLIIHKYIHNVYENSGSDAMGELVIQLQKDGVDLAFLEAEREDPYLDEPMSVTVYHEQAETLGQMDNKYGHDGHCLVETPNFIVDPTLGQTYRAGYLDVPAQIIIKKTEFQRLKPEDQYAKWTRFDWGLAFRSGEKDENGLSPIQKEFRSDLDGLLTEISCDHDLIGIHKIADQTFLGYSLRPDQEISEIYKRWNHPEFITNYKAQVKWIRKAFDSYFGKKSQIKIIDKGGKVRNDRRRLKNE